MFSDLAVVGIFYPHFSKLFGMYNLITDRDVHQKFSPGKLLTAEKDRLLLSYCTRFKVIKIVNVNYFWYFRTLWTCL